MLSVDFDRLGLRPGDRVLDMGCGAGRHAFEMYRRGADVIAFDQDADELSAVSDLFAAMRDAGEVPLGAEADVKEGDALSLPFADGEFDRVVASEVLEHIPADTDAIAELVRVLRPGGTIAVTVPRWLPERICWALSDAYHEVEGGHVRIYTGDELVAKLQAAGLSYDGRHYAHGLHSPYWWIKCAVGVDQRRAPAGEGLPPGAGVGHHADAARERADPGRRAGAQPADRQEPGAVPAQARVGLLRCGPEMPSVRGVLSAAEVAETAASIVAMQEPDGAVPWTVGRPRRRLEPRRGGDGAAWPPARSRLRSGPTSGAGAPSAADGSWPMKIVAGEVEDASGETNMSAYLAVGIWHHWLIRRDRAYVERFWPVVRRALDFVEGMQLSFGGIAWSQEWHDGVPAAVNRDALVAGSSSIYQSLRAGVALAEIVGEPQPAWELAGRTARPRAARAPRPVPGQERRSRWTGTTRSSVAPSAGRRGRALIDTRWDDFVVPGLGICCVDTNPWVTGAETCELVLALDALGDRARAVRLFADMQHLRDPGGRYWTGFVYPERGELAGRAHDVHRRRGRSSRRTRWPRSRATARPAPGSCAARH